MTISQDVDEANLQKALFLEFLPTASQGLLTLLSVWWPLGQLIGSLSKQNVQLLQIHH